MSEYLRDTKVAIGIDSSLSPLLELNKEMMKFTKNTGFADGAVGEMSKTFSSSTKGMIKESQAFNKEVNRQSDLIRQLAKTAGTSATNLAANWSDMSTEMKQSMIRNHNELRKHRKDLMGVEHDMWKLSSQMGHYTGSTNDFMDEINKLGKDHKKINDQMINSNTSMRTGMIQTVATMSAMSGQSEKISANYDRMGNAMYLVNKPLLSVTNNLERMARQGNTAALALKLLGPNAKMKELMDMTRMINQGIMRQTMLVTGMGVAWLGFTALMAHSAIGPDPAEIQAQQAEITKAYREEWQKRVDEIAHFVGIFEKVSIPKVSKTDVMKAMQSQLDAIKTFTSNMQSLINKGVDEGLIQELQKAGPQAAYHIKALDSMSKPELDKYVATWREKMGLAREQATSELTKLKQETDKKIKELQDSLTPLGKSWENFKATWSDASKPFVEFWGQFAAKIVDAGTAVGNFIDKLNGISPWITKLGGMFAFLFTTFMVILSPLAIGIGLFGGLSAAFSALWVIIGPFVLAFAAVAGTAALVSAAIIGLGVALYLLWTRSETFRNGVIAGWNAIKSAALSVWGFIRPYIMQAIGAVVQFGREKLAQFRQFWDENGAQILSLVVLYFSKIWSNIQVVIGLIKGIFQIVFPIIVGIVKIAWASLKLVINNGLTIIFGIIKTVLALIRGDWDGAWKAIKETALGIMKNIIEFFKNIDLKGTGKAIIQGLIDGIGSMAGALAKKVNSLTDGINWVMGKIGIDFEIPDWNPTGGGSSSGVNKIGGPAEYAKGTNYHPGGPAILGDGGGPELFRTPAGYMGLSPGKDTLMNIPRGTEVLPYKQSMQLLNSGFPAYKDGSKGKGSGGNILSKTASKVKDIGLDVWSYLSDPKKLMGKVFEKFGVSFSGFSGALGKLGSGTLDFLKDKATGIVKSKMGEMGSMGSFSGGFADNGQVRSWVTQALNMTNTPLSWLPAMMVKAQKESGYNPRAINLWDINAKRGIPSKGLFQTIDPTFNAYKMAGMNDIYNPIHNAVAAIRYIKSRYGTVFNTPGIKSMAHGGGYKGYATGTNGPLKKSEWAWVGEQGPELMRLNKGTEVFNHNDSMNIASGSYNPTNGVSSAAGGQTYIDYKPTVNVTVQGGSSEGNIEQRINDAVDKALDDHYQKLLSLFKSGVIV